MVPSTRAAIWNVDCSASTRAVSEVAYSGIVAASDQIAHATAPPRARSVNARRSRSSSVRSERSVERNGTGAGDRWSRFMDQLRYGPPREEGRVVGRSARPSPTASAGQSRTAAVA
jgi:hypothetical protein